MATEPTTALEYCDARGWRFTTLNGKIPIRKGWQREPPIPIADILAHAAAGGNVGLRTGPISGVVVVDLDPGAAPTGPLPDTVIVETGRGRHLYYACTAPVKNSAGKLGPHVDLRGEGGQVVFPGSTHPDTGTEYRFAPNAAPWERDLAPLPDWIPLALAARPTASTPRATPLARHALRHESRAVRSASEGARNDTLNTAAFNLGSLIAGGQIPEADVVAELTAAALAAGLTDAETDATIRSGLTAGAAEPRYPQARPAIITASPSDPESLPTVLIPGTHTTDDGTIEISSAEFASTALQAIPDGTLYSRSHLPGEVLGTAGAARWSQISTDRMRILVDRSIRLAAWVKRRPDPANPGAPEHCQSYRPCSKDTAGLIAAGAENSPRCREIDLIVNYPVYGPDWRLCAPGWGDGIYYDPPADLADVQPECDHQAIHDTFDELVTDFPFADAASRQNFLGLMLTPLVSRAVGGNRPLHLITASIERTGKSKLAEDVFGGIIIGRRTPAMQLSGTDEERDKRILALLLQGHTLLHFDNLPARLDSAALASLLTAQTYQGRALGSTKILSLPNTLTIVASGNNTVASGELAKRIIPIVLQPNTSTPEDRTNFQHPDLEAHVSKNRRALLAILLGMVENWRSQGMPAHPRPMGGFEKWARVIGGILHVNSFQQWRQNEKSWRVQSDTDTEERTGFVAAWWERWAAQGVSPQALLEVADQSDSLAWVLNKPTKRAQQTALGLWLRQHTNTPIGSWLIRARTIGNHREYYLERSKR